MGISAYIVAAYKAGSIKKADAIRWLLKSDSHLSIYHVLRMLGLSS